MIFYNDMLLKAHDNNPHDFVFVTKGDKKRSGGYIAAMNNSVITSSFHELSTFNIMSLNNYQVRKVYAILIIEFDKHKVVY